jgi:hypothetical protein
MRRRQSFGWGAECALLLASLLAASPAGALEAPDRVSVLTMGPGDHPFTRFGHNALLLEWDDGQHRKNAVYNFGTFEFRGLSGVRDFMAGRFRYWLSVTSLERTVRAYAADNRSLIAQELALGTDERFELYRALADNALPEHRYYDYDYYQDNCSTRVRDALNRVLSGSLQQSVVGPGRLTFRQHTLALTGDTPWLYLGLDLALGTPTDRPTTRWQELFLPRELHDALGRASRELGGQRVPLVLRETELLRAARTPLPRNPPARSLAFGAVGVALGGAFAALGRAARNQRAGRVLFGVLTALFGLALGLLGSALVIFWASKHWAAHANASLLGCPPWALALAGLGVAFALGRPHGLRKLRWLLGACAISASALLLIAVAQSGHESLRMALLFLPLWTGALWGARLAEPRGVLKP